MLGGATAGRSQPKVQGSPERGTKVAAATGNAPSAAREEPRGTGDGSLVAPPGEEGMSMPARASAKAAGAPRSGARTAKMQRSLTKKQAKALLGPGVASAAAEIAEVIADPYADAYHSFDTSILAVKQSARGRDARLKWFEWHCRTGHAGPGEMFGYKCRICMLLKGKLHRIFSKVDPFVPLQPGKDFVTDILTVNVRSKELRTYVMITRCLACGWFAPNVFLSLRTDAPRAFASMVKKLRQDPRYHGHGYPVVQSLRLDQAGEFTGAAWRKMVIEDLSIHCVYSPAEDKRGAPAQEAAVKHIAIMMKSIMLEKLVPVIYWEEACNQARRIRNLVPLARDIVSKDGDTKRPEEVMTRGITSRWACERLLAKTITVGSVCLVYNDNIIGSNLLETKATWMVAMKCIGELNWFMNPFTGSLKASNSWVMFTMPEHMGFPEFFELPAPPHMLAGEEVQRAAVPSDIIIELDGLSAMLKGARTDDDVVVNRHTATPIRGIFVVDKDTGDRWRHDENGVLRRIGGNGGDVGADITTITTTPGQPVRGRTVTAREFKIARLASEPTLVVGERFYQRFHDPNGVLVGDFMGVVQRHFVLPGTGSRWLCLYTDGDTRELAFDHVVHHVIDGYVTDPGLPDSEQVKYSHMSSTQSSAAAMAPAEGMGADGIVNPYCAIPIDRIGELDIKVRRKVVFTASTVAENRAGTVKTDRKTTFFKLCDTLGLRQRERRLYYNWLGEGFGENAKKPAAGRLGARFCNPWEGGSRPVIKNGSTFPIPEGDSWRQFARQYKRDGYAMHAAGTDRLLAEAAEGRTAAMAYAVHKTQIDAMNGEGYYDLNPANMGAPPSAKEVARSFAAAGRAAQGSEGDDEYMDGVRAFTVTAAAWQVALGGVLTEKDIKDHTDENNIVTHPKNRAATKGRPDEKQWDAAWEKEWGCIEMREVLSKPMRLSALRAMGIRARPVPLKMLYEIRSDPLGALSKWKCRLVLTAHSGFVARGKEFWATFAPSPGCNITRLMQYLVVAFGMIRMATDVTTAYLYGRVKKEERLPVKLPRDVEVRDPVTGEELFPCLLGSVYGFPSAGRRWAHTFQEFILGATFNTNHWSSFKARYGPCLYMFLHYRDGKDKMSPQQKAMPEMDRWGVPRAARAAKYGPDKTDFREKAYPASGGPRITAVFFVLHTDDLDVTADYTDDGHWVLEHIRRKFGLKDGNPDFMLGLTRVVEAGGRAMNVGMKGFIEGVYAEFKEMCPKKIPTMPYRAGTFMSRMDVQPTDNGIADYPKYGQLVGSVLWATRMAFPECAIIVHYCCRMLSCPTEEAWQAALYVLAYLYGQRDGGLRLPITEGAPLLRVFTDASNKKDQADVGKAVGGFGVFIGAALMEWFCSKNPHAGQSAQHNEYQALSLGAKSAAYYRFLLTEMGLKAWLGPGATPVSVDNNAAIALSTEDLLNHSNRFYELDTHYVKEAFEKGLVSPRYEPTATNVADLFTKCATRVVYESLVGMIKGTVPLPPVPPAPHG